MKLGFILALMFFCCDATAAEDTVIHFTAGSISATAIDQREVGEGKVAIRSRRCKLARSDLDTLGGIISRLKLSDERPAYREPLPYQYLIRLNRANGASHFLVMNAVPAPQRFRFDGVLVLASPMDFAALQDIILHRSCRPSVRQMRAK